MPHPLEQPIFGPIPTYADRFDQLFNTPAENEDIIQLRKAIEDLSDKIDRIFGNHIVIKGQFIELPGLPGNIKIIKITDQGEGGK
jgi:hypothetical protein